MVDGVDAAQGMAPSATPPRSSATLAFGRKHRVNGTPAVVFEDGTRMPGAIPRRRGRAACWSPPAPQVAPRRVRLAAAERRRSPPRWHRLAAAGRGRDAGAPVAGRTRSCPTDWARAPPTHGRGASRSPSCANCPRGAAGRCGAAVARPRGRERRRPAPASSAPPAAAPTAPEPPAPEVQASAPEPVVPTAALDARVEPGGARTRSAPPSTVAAAEAGSAPALPASSGGLRRWRPTSSGRLPRA